MRALAMIVFGLAAPAFAAEQQFDLACTGTRIVRQGGAAEPHAFELRIDLAAQRWCMDACPAARPIAAVSADTLTLVDDSTYNTRTDASDSVSVDRRSWAFRQLAMQSWPDDRYLKVAATCRPAPFRPLPPAS